MHEKPSAVRLLVRAFSRDDAVSSGNLTLLSTDATLSVAAASPEDDDTAARALSASFFFFFFLLFTSSLMSSRVILSIRGVHQPLDETALCACTFAVFMPNQLVGQTSDHDATYIACSTVEFAILGWSRRNRRFALASACTAAARPLRLCCAAPRCVLIAAPAAAAASPRSSGALGHRCIHVDRMAGRDGAKLGLHCQFGAD
ncbi:hypothetical protein THAOC_29103 [Thalassiosira oceanica]|uniref:Uncharacterized protein n=1 Tax=Thalassiosira oceanica TaxID=159749 RepID=K0RDD7_THAOC|nr:hypothetical protein THAOC_29103 [Thalassiosira oceanica]|eukprot:EJK51703.1 hypothetical protein THAOC_29103 [Thalassiosira oceanica]